MRRQITYILSIVVLVSVMFTEQTKQYKTRTLNLEYSAEQSYTKEQPSFQVITNDIALVLDSILKFTIEIKEGELGEKVVFENSNPNVAIIKDESNKTNGDVVEIELKAYGRTAITVSLEKNSDINQTVQVYVNNYDYIKFDSLYSIQITSKDGINSIDPMKQGDNYLKSGYEFYAKSQYKATDFAKYEWSSKPKAEISLSKTLDTAYFNFITSGEHSIYMKNPATGAIFDSLSFFVNLHDSINLDQETGYLSNLMDTRDGELYDIIMVPTATDTFFFMNENLRYTPYIYPLLAYGSKLNKPYVFKSDKVFTYNLEQAYDSIHISPSFNHIALMQQKDNSYSYSSIKDSKKNSYCPPGWYIPTKDELMKLFADDPSASTTGIITANTTHALRYNFSTHKQNGIIEIENGSTSVGPETIWLRGDSELELFTFSADKARFTINSTDYTKKAAAVRCIYKK